MKIKICSILCITTLLLTNKSFGQFVITPAVTNSNPLSTNGDVGIGTGTSIQSAKLHIFGTTNQLRLAKSTTVFSDINSTANGLNLNPNAGGISFGDPTITKIIQINPNIAGSGDVPPGASISSYMTSATEGLSLYSSGSSTSLSKLGAYAFCINGWKSMWETANTGSGGALPNLLLVKSGGKVGIGTGATAPDKLLTVKSTIANTQIAKFADDMRYIGLGRDEVAAFDLSGVPAHMYLGGTSNPTTKVTILNTGFVGIGTTTPGAKLEVAGQVKIVDGTQGAGKVLTSDANGLASWTTTNGLLSGGTTNYIPKWTSANTLSSTSSIYDNGFNVGIGTNNPSEHFQIGDRFVFHDGGSKYLGYNTHYDGSSNVRLVNDYSSVISFGGGDITFQTDGMGIPGSVINATTKLVIKNTGEVGIGTPLNSNPYNYKLAVNGAIGCKAFKVEINSTAWSDFVFDKDYKLMTLNELEVFINKNKHLPNIPSNAEVDANNGIDVVEIESKLLQKVEELTLYIIQQQKEIEELKKYVKK